MALTIQEFIRWPRSVQPFFSGAARNNLTSDYADPSTTRLSMGEHAQTASGWILLYRIPSLSPGHQDTVKRYQPNGIPMVWAAMINSAITAEGPGILLYRATSSLLLNIIRSPVRNGKHLICFYRSIEEQFLWYNAHIHQVFIYWKMGDSTRRSHWVRYHCPSIAIKPLSTKNC